MAPIGLYGTLATTAGVFVGLLNAYLVSRISEMKGERRRIEKRVKSIDARLEPLMSHRDWRDEQISNQVDQRASAQAQDDIGSFINHYVGEDWSPNPDDLTLGDIIDGLTEYLDQDRSALTNYHIEEIRERWGDIQDELRPTGGAGPLGMNIDMGDIAMDSSTRATINQIEAQWEIYDRTLLDRRNADLASVTTEIESLREERERLIQQYSGANPSELVDGVTSTGWAIALSVGVPMLIYLLHAIELTLTNSLGSLIEPIIVFISWSVGLILTFQYVRSEVKDVEDSLPEPSSSGDNQEYPEEESEIQGSD